MKRNILAVAAGILIAMTLMGAACAPVQQLNPIQAGCRDLSAATVGLCGFATYGTFVVFQRLALGVATDAGPGDVRNKLIAAEDAAKGPADSLLAAVVNYEQVRADLAAGTSTQEKVAIATANLQMWLTNAKPLIDDLVRTYSDAKTRTRTPQ